MEGLQVLLASFFVIGVTPAWSWEYCGPAYHYRDICYDGCCSTSNYGFVDEHCCPPESAWINYKVYIIIGAIIPFGVLVTCCTCFIKSRVRGVARERRRQTVTPVTVTTARNGTQPTITYISMSSPGVQPRPRMPLPTYHPMSSTFHRYMPPTHPHMSPTHPHMSTTHPHMPPTHPHMPPTPYPSMGSNTCSGPVYPPLPPTQMPPPHLHQTLLKK